MRYEVVSPLALYDAMSQHQNTLNKQNAALGMMQTNGWGGGAGILGAALGGLLANKYGQEANQQQAEIAKQQFLYEQQQHRLAQEAQAQAEQALQTALGLDSEFAGADDARRLLESVRTSNSADASRS